jgi:hypothetical protein
MIDTENKVNVKYKTKNNITDDNPVFLEIKNQMNTRISSTRNFKVIETRLCKVWLAGSFPCPRKKINNINNERIVKIPDSINKSPKDSPISNMEIIKIPAITTTASSRKSSRKYFKNDLKSWIIFS